MKCFCNILIMTTHISTINCIIVNSVPPKQMNKYIERSYRDVIVVTMMIRLGYFGMSVCTTFYCRGIRYITAGSKMLNE